MSSNVVRRVLRDERNHLRHNEMQLLSLLQVRASGTAPERRHNLRATLDCPDGGRRSALAPAGFAGSAKGPFSGEENGPVFTSLSQKLARAVS
jgi:hypothetical protein